MLRLVSDLNKEKIAIVVVGYNRLYPIQPAVEVLRSGKLQRK